MATTANKPVLSLYLGNVSISVWKHERTRADGTKFFAYSASPSQSYRNDKGERQFTDSFDHYNLANLAALALQAAEKISTMKKENAENDELDTAK